MSRNEHPLSIHARLLGLGLTGLGMFAVLGWMGGINRLASAFGAYAVLALP